MSLMRLNISGDVLLDATAQKLVMLNGVDRSLQFVLGMARIMANYSDERFCFWCATFLRIVKFKVL